MEELVVVVVVVVVVDLVFGSFSVEAKGSCHMVFRSPFKYAIAKSGNNVNGTKYSKAGWAALKT